MCIIYIYIITQGGGRRTPALCLKAWSFSEHVTVAYAGPIRVEETHLPLSVSS